MELVWLQRRTVDGSSDRTLLVSRESDWRLFEQVAAELESRLGGTWVARADGLDQRYWDLAAPSGRLTLHLEHYLGIVLFAARGAERDAESLLLLDRAARVLVRFDPV